MNTQRLVHPAQTATILLANVANCLLSAITLSKIPKVSGVAPVEILLRTALIGSCRAALIVEPEDENERRTNAYDIARADFNSAQRAWSVMGAFEHTIENARGAQVVFEEFLRDFPAGRPPSDGGFINRMTRTLARQFSDPLDAAFMREQLLMVWHGYSGVAHGNTWQHSLSGSVNGVSESTATGPLFHHMNLLAKLADFNLTMLEKRLRAWTADQTITPDL